MLKYIAAAAALKAFSVNSLSKKLYRKIGNTIGQRNRLAVDDIDIRISRGNLLVDLCRKHNAVRDGDRILEIGTGWMHFYSLYLRLFYDLQVSALDIWDNRQFAALQAAARRLVAATDSHVSEPKAQDSLRKIIGCKSYEELYSVFGYKYFIEPTGSIGKFADSEFDFITSFHVLEHVPTRFVEKLAHDMFRKLKPGAYTIHQIGIDDHLTHYDSKASPKQYLKYSDRIWRLLFENDVQYFNRLQTSDWLSTFADAGFELVDKIHDGVSVDSLHIDTRFRSYPKEDLECTTLTVVYRKPSR